LAEGDRRAFPDLCRANSTDVARDGGGDGHAADTTASKQAVKPHHSNRGDLDIISIPQGCLFPTIPFAFRVREKILRGENVLEEAIGAPRTNPRRLANVKPLK
jgi:hypothetical protein